MRNLIRQMLRSFSSRDLPAGAVEGSVGVPPSGAVHRLMGVERAVPQQSDQLVEARVLLQQAAHLARYHQPSLERQIRSLLVRMDAGAGPLLLKDEGEGSGRIFRLDASSGKLTA